MHTLHALRTIHTLHTLHTLNALRTLYTAHTTHTIKSINTVLLVAAAGGWLCRPPKAARWCEEMGPQDLAEIAGSGNEEVFGWLVQALALVLSCRGGGGFCDVWGLRAVGMIRCRRSWRVTGLAGTGAVLWVC